MTEQIIEVEAESLAEARKQLRLRLSKGLLLYSEQVVSDGKPTSVLGTANTAEEAFVEAQKKVPVNAHILSEKLLRVSQERVITIEASNEVNARAVALGSLDTDANEVLQQVLLRNTGKKGVFGIGAIPNRYEVHFLQQAIAEITYTTRAKISAKMGTALEKSASIPKQIARMVPSLIRQLLQRDEHYSVVWVQRIRTAAEALGEIGDPRAVEPLVDVAVTFDFTRAAQDEVKKVITEALKKIGDPLTIDVLIAKFKNEPYGSHACNAVEMLGRMQDPRAIEFLLDARIASGHRLLEVFGESWRPLQREVLIALRTIAEALGEMENPRAVELLVEIAVTLDVGWSSLTHVGVEKAVEQALKKISDPHAIDMLIARCKNNPASSHTQNAIEMLGRMGDPHAVEFLVDFRVADGHTLFELTDERWSTLKEVVVVALGKIGDKRAVEVLIPLLTEVRLESKVIWALGAIGDARAADALLALLQHGPFRFDIAEALLQIKDVRVVSLLIAELGDERDNEAVAGLLREILEHQSASIPSEELHAIAQLKNRYRWKTVTISTGNTELDAIYGQSTVEEAVAIYGYLRQLAQKELVRRGLEI